MEVCPTKRIALSRNATDREMGFVLALMAVALAGMNIALVWLAWVIQFQKSEILELKKLLGW